MPANPTRLQPVQHGQAQSRLSAGHDRTSRRRLLGGLAAGSALALLGACANLPGREPVRVNVVGVDPLPAQGLELRFAVRLRVVNPNDTPVTYDGTFVELDVADRPLASGVSNQRGEVPRFGETLLTIPVSISGLSMLRQVLGMQGQTLGKPVDFHLRGRLNGPGFSSVNFSDRGSMSLPTDWTRIIR